MLSPQRLHEHQVEVADARGVGDQVDAGDRTGEEFPAAS
jgi:hypothetical protein